MSKVQFNRWHRLWKETVLEPASPGFYTAVPAARLQQGELLSYKQ